MEYYKWTSRMLAQTAARTADTAAWPLQLLISSAVRGLRGAGAGLHQCQCEAASLGILSLARDVILASVLLLYKLLVIAYR